MSEAKTSNKTIAKNTIALYIRMMFTMLISLYTSRIVLRYLGVEDYGIQNTVGGVVGMLAYMNGALNVGSSRFLTYELGTGNKEKLQKTFSSVLSVHLIFALIVFVLGETIGLWFVYNKLVIPEERMFATVWCYHLSILSCMMSITQVPYGASIISHEKMSLYAYTSIIDVSAKLGIVYLLTITPWDRLITYSTLGFIISISMRTFYRWYCVHNFEEAHYTFTIDKKITSEILQYSGWNIFATTSVALVGQGVTVITNMFFNPSVVASRAIANQVNSAARGFYGNFKAASDPQIVKSYAAGKYEESKKLNFQTAKYGYFLMLILALPICLAAKPILLLWLRQVPEYSVIYLQFALLTSLAAVFDLQFYTALYAKGQIKENSIISSSSFFLGFIATYVLFRLGYSPVWSAVMVFISQCIIAFVIKPIMMVKIVGGYQYREIFQLFKECLKVTIVSSIIPVPIYFCRDLFAINEYVEFLVIVPISVLSVAITVWTIGLDDKMRSKLLLVVRQKLHLK